LAWYSLLIKEAETISVVSHFNIVIKDTLIIYHTTTNNATPLQKDIKKKYLTHRKAEGAVQSRQALGELSGKSRTWIFL
jgi:aromatic ring-opening dioxygenase LigB subunit